jgi:hypothetical protein
MKNIDMSRRVQIERVATGMPKPLRGTKKLSRLLAVACSMAVVGSLCLTAPAASAALPADSSTANSGDYATDSFGDPWDFNNAEDLTPQMRGLSVGITNLAEGPITATNSVLSGRAAPSSYLMLADTLNGTLPWGRDTQNYPMNANRYTQLTMSMYSTGPMGAGVFYDLCKGASSSCYNGSPFQVSTGWHTYTIDLTKATIYYATHQRWGGSAASMLRLGFNPPTGTNFQIDWIRLGTAGTTTLNPAQPQVTITRPSIVSGADYATTVRGRPWNFQGPADLTLGGIGDVQYSTAGLRAKNIVTTAIPRGNDPHIGLVAPTPIVGSKYNQFSVNVCYDGKFGLADSPGGGMNGRVIWRIAGESFLRNSQDFLVFPGCQVINLNLSVPANVVEDEADAKDVGGFRGFAGQSIAFIRFDPHEDPGTRYFSVHSIRLTATDRGTGGFPIQFSDRNWKTGTTADIWLDPTGTGTSTRQIARGISTTSGGNTFNWAGRDIGNVVVPSGSYFVKIRLSSGAVQTGVYSTGRFVLTATS